jgi:hypothetical protein
MRGKKKQVLLLESQSRAIVLPGDKKNQIEALDRIESGVTMKYGRGATMRYDYGRNGVAQ